jgi:uncharacterized UPF0146 family protein
MQGRPKKVLARTVKIVRDDIFYDDTKLFPEIQIPVALSLAGTLTPDANVDASGIGGCGHIFEVAIIPLANVHWDLDAVSVDVGNVDLIDVYMTEGIGAVRPYDLKARKA